VLVVGIADETVAAVAAGVVLVWSVVLPQPAVSRHAATDMMILLVIGGSCMIDDLICRRGSLAVQNT